MCIVLSSCDSDNLPVEVEDLTDRLWTLETYIDREGVVTLFSAQQDFEFTIMFDSLQAIVTGVNVCNNFGGQYEIGVNEITLSGIEEDTAFCEFSNIEPSLIFNNLLRGNLGSSSSSFDIDLSPDDRLSIVTGEDEVLIFTDEL